MANSKQPNLSDVIAILTNASTQNDIVNALKNLATVLNTNQAISTNQLFSLIMNNIAIFPSNDALPQFNSIVNQIISIFDANNDGIISEADLEIFKVQQFENITSAIAKSILVIHSLTSSSGSSMFTVNLTTQNIITITYRIILYAIFLPLVLNVDTFRTFLSNDENINLLAESINYLYALLLSSQDVDNLVSKIRDYFSNKCSSGACCDSATVTTVKNEAMLKSANIAFMRASAHSKFMINIKTEALKR